MVELKSSVVLSPVHMERSLGLGVSTKVLLLFRLCTDLGDRKWMFLKRGPRGKMSKQQLHFLVCACKKCLFWNDDIVALLLSQIKHKLVVCIDFLCVCHFVDLLQHHRLARHTYYSSTLFWCNHVDLHCLIAHRNFACSSPYVLDLCSPKITNV